MSKLDSEIKSAAIKSAIAASLSDAGKEYWHNTPEQDTFVEIAKIEGMDIAVNMIENAAKDALSDDGEERCQITGMTKSELESLCGCDDDDLVLLPEPYEEICPHTGMTRTECECVFGCHEDDDLVLKLDDQDDDEPFLFVSNDLADVAQLLPVQEAMDNPHNDTITSVRESIQYGDCTVYGVINGEERKLFLYYIDELSINANDLIGMTSAEAIEHKHNADVAYLRS